MTNQIEAVLFDMGGTLRNSIKTDEASKKEAVSRIIALLGADATVEEFVALLTERSRAYMRWARETTVELNERDLWTKWLLPDWPAEQISKLAVQLNQLWREGTGKRIIFPETKEVIVELFRRGYRLGLVSNTVSSVEVPQAFKELEITGYFDTVILSCQVGMRKPNPAILLEAARRMGVEPVHCAYVGDRLDRDVNASRGAGFAQVVIRRDQADFLAHQAKHPEFVADQYIDDLRALLPIFPARKQRAPIPVYQASLSTMWAKKNFTNLEDFFRAAGRLGFSHIELNHQIDSAMLGGIDLNNYRFSSVHEPCPADISTEDLKQRDWLISSPDEENRKLGVESIKRSIDLARQLNAPVIVVHCGMVSNDLSVEAEMRRLFEAGKKETDEYWERKEKLMKRRADLIGPCLDAVKRSLLELLDYAAPFRIRLGLENRYHYFDIPSLEEMGELLSLAGPDRLGFIYDMGHAQALDRLGFFPHEEWLRCYGSRMFETHIHDTKGVTDHQAPGMGEVDFGMLAKYMPENAIRTFEVQVSNSPEQVRAGLKFLVERGSIKPI